MPRKVLLALSIVLLLPVVSYWIVKNFSSRAISMPRRYYPDSVVNKVVDGKSVTDTVWHKLGNVMLTNQLGQQVSLDSLTGKILVADLFFTRCPHICPQLTHNMKRLQDGLKLRDKRRLIDTPFVHFLSITVDPEHDSVPVLKKYADKFEVDHDEWWFLTGPKKTIYDFALHELKVGLEDKQVDSNFIHATRFILLDKDRIVRGYYNGLDTTSLKKLAGDITLLLLEKDKKKKRKLF